MGCILLQPAWPQSPVVSLPCPACLPCAGDSAPWPLEALGASVAVSRGTRMRRPPEVSVAIETAAHYLDQLVGLTSAEVGSGSLHTPGEEGRLDVRTRVGGVIRVHSTLLTLNCSASCFQSTIFLARWSLLCTVCLSLATGWRFPGVVACDDIPY